MIKNYFQSIEFPQGPIPASTPPLTQKYPSLTQDKAEGEDAIEVEEPEVTYQDRMRFSERLKQLSPAELGVVVSMIQEESEALRFVDKDRAHIVVDNISNELFYRLLE